MAVLVLGALAATNLDSVVQVLTSIGGAVAVFTAATAILNSFDWWARILVYFGIAEEVEETEPPPTLEHRVEQLSRSLSVAVRQISEIEQEIEARQQLVGKLRADVERNEQLMRVSAAQAEAVAQVLRGELTRVERRTTRRDVVLGAIYFLLGSGASLLFVFIFK